LGSSLSLSYTDRWGVDLYYTPSYPDIQIAYYPEGENPTITGVTPMAIVGNLICVCGYFPDEQSRNGILLDGKSLGPPISASKHTLVFRLPEDIQPGIHTVSGSAAAGFLAADAKNFDVIRIRGSIDRTKLRRGESTPLRMSIEGTDKVLNISLSNETPEIITLDGGDRQVIPTSGGRNNGFEKIVHGHTAGDFVLNYELDLSFCPCAENDRPTEETPFFENLFDESFYHFRRARGSADAASRNRIDNLELAKLRARESLETFTRTREKLNEGIENGDIGPNAAATFQRFISEYETQARAILELNPEEEELPIAHIPESTPEEQVVAVVTDGWLAPSQAVWQDDDVFDDFQTKQLTRTTPGQWNAELKMVVNKRTDLFGIREDGRNRIKMAGATNGTRLVRVKFRFKLIQGGTERIIYTQPRAENNVALDGPVGSFRPWAASYMVTRGLPSHRRLVIDQAGAYRIEAELIREDGTETGLKIAVSGEAIRTFGPDVKIVPAVLSSSNPTGYGGHLAHTAQQLATESQEEIPRFFPLAPGGMTVGAEPLSNLRRLEPGTVRKLVSLLPFTDTSEVIRRDSLTAALAQRFGTGSAMTGGPKVVLLLSDNDFDLTYRPLPGTSGARAYCASTKFIVARHDIFYKTVAHELVHSMPYPWAEEQMIQAFGKNYHNYADNRYGDGVRVPLYGRSILQKRKHAIMGAAIGGEWITQATYWHLLNQFRQKPDPELLLIRGFVARDGGKRNGYFLPFYRLTGVADLQASTSIPNDSWRVSVRDKAGQEIAQYPIYTRWRTPDLDVERKILSFTQRIPWAANMHTIHLISPSGQVEQKTISASAPIVKIQSPLDNSTVTPTGRKVKLTWQGSDPDNDALVYSVYYSPDDGRKWRLVMMDQQTDSLELELPGRPKKVRVKVVVTDGIRSGSDEIGFQIE